ncbi:MAG: GldG family protein, partial [Saprospiraceae bacterium]|nr:GldG family protein [Saprospiraceae bacterium]
MKNAISLILLAGILLLVNLLSRQFFFRLDLTKDKQFTLSKASVDILENLEDPVFVKAYFTEVEGFEKVREDFRDLLVEYSTRSKGMVDFEFINPNESPESEQIAQQDGIQPILVQVRKADQSTQQRAYLGAVLEMGEQVERIPLVQPGSAMEYDLTTSIKKISVLDKPSVGFISGYGTAGQEQLAQAIQQLSILYTVENVDLSGEVPSPARYRALALLGPKD